MMQEALSRMNVKLQHVVRDLDLPRFQRLVVNNVVA
jgi:hypothetical protein